MTRQIEKLHKEAEASKTVELSDDEKML